MSTITTEKKAAGAGIVSDDGNGLYTFADGTVMGGIIESGSNEYGSYIKFSDGTLEQWGRVLGSTGTYSPQTNIFGTTSGTTYVRYETITFTIPFVGDLPIITAQSDVYVTRDTVGLASFRWILTYGADPGPYYYDWCAIGRWKA